MIEIKNLTAKIDDKEILRGINLTVKKGAGSSWHSELPPGDAGSSGKSEVGTPQG
jgi:Fe-S cluster assembly ATP-binding protein